MGVYREMQDRIDTMYGYFDVYLITILVLLGFILICCMVYYSGCCCCTYYYWKQDLCKCLEWVFACLIGAALGSNGSPCQQEIAKVAVMPNNPNVIVANVCQSPEQDPGTNKSAIPP